MKKRVFCLVMTFAALMVLVAVSTACRRDGAVQKEIIVSGSDKKSKAIHIKYTLERYGDKAFASEPRLQFTWKLTGEKEESIWSIKLDGSDLQQAVDAKVLTEAGLRNIHEAPRRSWDNRWLAVAGWGGEQRMLVLVDLKDGTAKKLIEELGTAWPCWSLDSKKLYFSTMEGLRYYEIDTGEIKKMSKGAAKLYSFPGKDYYLFLMDFGYGKADSNFENVQRFELIPFGTSIMAFSPDGRYLLVPEPTHSRFNLFDLENNNEKLTINGQGFSADIALDPQNEYIYYGLGYELHRFNWKTFVEELVFKTDGGIMFHFSIINYGENGQVQ